MIATLLALAILSSNPRPAWADFDRDGDDTREEILAERCIVTRSATGRITAAACLDQYTGQLTTTPEVDHLYPQAEARKRMACWGERTFAEFFNDPDNLVVTSRAVNRSKGDRMPGAWCPPNAAARVWAARKLRAVVEAQGLPLTGAEEIGLAAWARGEC
jgi:hypothetical protein